MKRLFWIVISVVLVFVLIAFAIFLVNPGKITGMFQKDSSVLNMEKINDQSSSQENEQYYGLKEETLTKTERIKISDYNALLSKIIDLRESSIRADILKKAQLVTDINFIIEGLNNPVVKENWDSVALSIARNNGNYSDNLFLDFIGVIALESSKINSYNGELITFILTADKYWNTDNTIKFSEALTNANNMIEVSNEEYMSLKWQEIIKCDGKCSEKSQLMFDMIKIIVS